MHRRSRRAVAPPRPDLRAAGLPAHVRGALPAPPALVPDAPQRVQHAQARVRHAAAHAGAALGWVPPCCRPTWPVAMSVRDVLHPRDCPARSSRTASCTTWTAAARSWPTSSPTSRWRTRCTRPSTCPRRSRCSTGRRATASTWRRCCARCSSASATTPTSSWATRPR